MLDKRKLIIDKRCQAYLCLKDYADEEFWNLANHEFKSNSVYVISDAQFYHWLPVIKKVVNGSNNIVFAVNFFVEVNEHIQDNVNRLRIIDLIHQGKILLIGPGKMEPSYRNLPFDSYVIQIPRYKNFNMSNILSTSIPTIYENLDKPYKFLFLGGRYRWYRKNFLEKLSPLLDCAIWSNPDSKNGKVQWLDNKYEVDTEQVQNASNMQFTELNKAHISIKHSYSLLIPAYADSYFSVVSETVFEYPYSCRTEKIWKPIIAGHPWVTLATYGFYRDLKNLGFRTFDHLIDESFDLIENDQDRLNKVSAVIHDLCKQNLSKFFDQCRDICVYNQQHFVELGSSIKKEFPSTFFQFLKENNCSIETAC